MPSVGKRETRTIADMSTNPMYEYASKFFQLNRDMINENAIDYALEPIRAMSYQANLDAMKEFFVEESLADDPSHMTAEQIQDHRDMMTEAFINDVMALRENAVAGMATFNPMIGLSLPMHKYLMMNCVFAQAIPRFVAKSPRWTESIESRYMVMPDGTKIDIARQQGQIFRLWKTANPPIEVPLALPEVNSTDILDKYFNESRVDAHLSVATHINAVAVEDFVKKGDSVVVIDSSTHKVTEGTAASDGVALVWKPWKAEFTPGYGDANRIIVQPVKIVVSTDGTSATETVMEDTLFASQKDNMFEINSTAGKIKAVKMFARYDASARTRKTPKVEWGEKTIFVQIPENDGITVPVTPEEVKDIGALYGINQVTKYMDMIRSVLENVKDDDIHQELNDSFLRLDDDHRLTRAIDFAPRSGYYDTHLKWLQETFMNTLDQYITGLLTVLKDPNVTITIIGRPAIIRQITPIEYSYETPNNVGPIELTFKKTVVTSDKRTYQFVSSDKMWGADTLIVLLNPKNTNRIIYRLYDYQMYISNEIRDATLPHLPALTAFQRYKFFELFGVQGRLQVVNPYGLTSHPRSPAPEAVATGIGHDVYANNDLGSVYTHYDEKSGTNMTTDEQLARDAAEAAANASSGSGGNSGNTTPTNPSTPTNP